MIFKYEKAYREACADEQNTMDEKQTKKVRNYIDGQDKKLHKDKKREEKGIVFNSLETIIESGEKGLQILGTSTDDPADIAIHNVELAELRKCLAKLSEEDRKIILTIYGCDPKKEKNVKRASEILGMKRTTVSGAHTRILQALKEEYFKENKNS